MLRQPLTVCLGEEEDEDCLKLFYTIQLHAGKLVKRNKVSVIVSSFYCFELTGITPSSGQGFEDVDPDDVITMVQMAIQRCIEKEALCNEFYLQLIKQTTEQPGQHFLTSLSF